MSKGKSIDDYSPEELVEEARGNHIWLNAFMCVRPTDDFKKDIGDMILKKLEYTDMRDSLGISKMIILTVNKS